MSYLSVDELNELMLECFTTSELDAIDWNNISEADKVVYIKKVTLLVDTLNYKGIKASIGQELKFPRVVDGVLIELPDSIKVFIANKIFTYVFESVNNMKYKTNKSIKKVKIGDIEEEYFDDSVSRHMSIDSYTRDMYFKRYLANYAMVY